ncbi:MAG: hypothetical protein H6Q90_4969 [Deltaproteobacteria bacterium]|nr:hypothetical protein [Deltaproteobacteria bacterium]
MTAVPYTDIMVFGVAAVAALALVWWWVARMQVSAAPVAMKTARIGLPAGGLRMHEPALALAKLDQPEEIVIPFEHAMLVIAYPLTTPASIPISASISQGFTRAELVRAICEEYANVYDAEEGSTAASPTVPMEDRLHPYGRNRTDGAYGIFGHDLQDLVLTSVRWTRKSNGTIMIEPNVEGSSLKLHE